MNTVKKLVVMAVVMLSISSNVTYAHNGMGCCGEGAAAAPVTAGATSPSLPLGVNAVKEVVVGTLSMRQAAAIIIISGPIITWWNVTGAEYISKGIAYVRAYYSKESAPAVKKCCSHEHNHYAAGAR